MSKQSIILWVVSMLIIGFSQNLAAQAKTTPSKENVTKAVAIDATDAPQRVQNKASKNPIRSTQPSLKKEIKGLQSQLNTLKKIDKPSPFILKKIDHLEQQLTRKQKQQTTTPNSQ